MRPGGNTLKRQVSVQGTDANFGQRASETQDVYRVLRFTSSPTASR